MATLAQPAAKVRGERFFLVMAFVFATIVVLGFSTQLAMGRSTFASPLRVHVHAVLFMGWVAIYLLQNIFATVGPMRLHQRLGWIAAGWTLAMIAAGFFVTISMARAGTVPFFFAPLNFLIFDPLALLTFAGLNWAAIARRRDTDWHKRLHYCSMAILMGPAFGRLMPMPLLSPYAYEATFAGVMIFPIIGIVRDITQRGSVHRAWWWGTGALVASLLVTETLTYSPVGLAIYRNVTSGSPGAALDPLGFRPPPPPGVTITGR